MGLVTPSTIVFMGMKARGMIRVGSSMPLRRVRRDERGQSLIIVVLAMLAVFALAALAIDVADWYQARHQAQVAADAGALAGAQNLNTSTTAANADASAYAVGGPTAEKNSSGQTITVAGNDPGGSATVTEPTSTTVKVTVSKAAPIFFAGVFGLHPTVSASATASNVSGPVIPSAIFAGETGNCTGNSGNPHGVILSGSVTVTGGIYSNDGFNPNGGPTYTGSDVFTTNCAPPTGGTEETAPVNYPLDYSAGTLTSTLLNSCTYSDSTPPPGMSGSAGNTWNVTATSTPTVYCDPNGTINLSGSGSVTAYASNVGFANGSSVSGALTDPAGEQLLAYQTGTASQTFSGNGSLTGVIFYPNATFKYTGTTTFTGFVEANIVVMDGTINGTGPNEPVSNNNGCCALTQ